MNEGSDEPDGEARTKHNPQRQVPVETDKGHQEKQDAWHNPYLMNLMFTG